MWQALTPESKGLLKKHKYLRGEGVYLEFLPHYFQYALPLSPVICYACSSVFKILIENNWYFRINL